MSPHRGIVCPYFPVRGNAGPFARARTGTLVRGSTGRPIQSTAWRFRGSSGGRRLAVLARDGPDRPCVWHALEFVVSCAQERNRRPGDEFPDGSGNYNLIRRGELHRSCRNYHREPCDVFAAAIDLSRMDANSHLKAKKIAFDRERTAAPDS